MILLVLGRRGCGKTTLVKARLASLSRVLVFDTLGEYGSVAETFTDFETFSLELEDRAAGVFRLALACDPVTEDSDATLDRFLRSAWIVGDVTVVIDEIDAVASPTSVPVALKRIIRYGRHRDVAVIAASRRAAEVPRLLTSQADEIVSFNQSEPLDLDYLRRYVSADFAGQVSNLPRFEYRTYIPWGQLGDSHNMKTEALAADAAMAVGPRAEDVRRVALVIRRNDVQTREDELAADRILAALPEPAPESDLDTENNP